MAKSELRLIKRVLEYLPIAQVDDVPGSLRGIYVLYKRRRSRTQSGYHYNFVYIGMTTSGIRGRLRSHKKERPTSGLIFQYLRCGTTSERKK